MLKQFLVYAFRWQLSSPILAICIIYLPYNSTIKTILANLIGSIIFFWVDKYIFTSKTLNPTWEVKEEIKCVDCGQISRGYRLVKSGKYDKSEGVVEFRCEKCSEIKSKELKSKGIKI